MPLLLSKNGSIDEFFKNEDTLMIDLSLSSDLHCYQMKEANRAQFSIFIFYIETATNSPKEMKELEEMFVEKNINKSLIMLSGLERTNTISGEKKGLQCDVLNMCLLMHFT